MFMSCVLRANGSNFLVDRFLEECDLVPCVVYRKGERRPISRSGNEVNDAFSGLHVVVSNAEFDDLQGQIQDAISFMQKHQMELRRLCEFPGVEGVTLDFGIARRDVVAQFEYLPPELLSLAG